MCSIFQLKTHNFLQNIHMKYHAEVIFIEKVLFYTNKNHIFWL